MNTFESNRRFKNDILVCVMFDKMMFDPSLRFRIVCGQHNVRLSFFSGIFVEKNQCNTMYHPQTFCFSTSFCKEYKSIHSLLCYKNAFFSIAICQKGIEFFWHGKWTSICVCFLILNNLVCIMSEKFLTIRAQNELLLHWNKISLQLWNEPKKKP